MDATPVSRAHLFKLSLRACGTPLISWTKKTYNRFSDAAAEVREARIRAGIHFRTTDELGGTIGVAIADYAVDNFLQPVADDEQ